MPISSPRNVHVMVTGAAGFLGSHLCDALLAGGHCVVGVDNLLTGSLRNLEHLKRDSRFSFLQQDICSSFDPGPVDLILTMACAFSTGTRMQAGIETLQVG